MRKIILLLLTISMSFVLKATENNDFSYDREKLKNAFKEVDKLEEIVTQNPGSDVIELYKNKKVDIEFMEFNAVISPAGEPPLGIPSFLWGCVFGIAGIMVVLIMTDKDKNEISQAFYGCITTYALVGVFYLVVFYNTI